MEFYEYKGKVYTIAELARIARCSYYTMIHRLNHCETVEECMHTSFKSRKKHKYNGREYTSKELAEKTHCSEKAMRSRGFRHGIKEAVEGEYKK